MLDTVERSRVYGPLFLWDVVDVVVGEKQLVALCCFRTSLDHASEATNLISVFTA